MKPFSILSILTSLLIVLLAACGGSPTEVQGSLTVQDFGTTVNDFARDVATPKGGVGAVVVGYTGGSLNAPNIGFDDAFIRRYDDGVGWAWQFGTRFSDYATNITMTTTGISYVAGYTYGALRFKVGGADVFLRKYDAAGILQWTRQFGTTGTDRSEDVALDSSGNVYVLSSDSDAAYRVRKFNPSGRLLQTITNTSSNITAMALAIDSTGNIFVLTQQDDISVRWGKIYKYSSAGTLLSSPIVSGEQTTPYDLVIDSNNNVTYSLSNSEANSDGGGFVIRMNNALTQYLWIKSIEPVAGSRVSEPQALTLDSINHVYVTGHTTGSYPNFLNQGSSDIFVLKLASGTGNRLWTRQFGSNGSDIARGIAVSDAVYVAGYSSSDPNLLGDPGYGGNDAFLAQLRINNGVILGIDQ